MTAKETLEKWKQCTESEPQDIYLTDSDTSYHLVGVELEDKIRGEIDHE